jgi:hypothetical protein
MKQSCDFHSACATSYQNPNGSGRLTLAPHDALNHAQLEDALLSLANALAGQRILYQGVLAMVIDL